MVRVVVPAFACLVAIAAGAQQLPEPIANRDLRITRLGSLDELKVAVQVPRGYALVIGISTYRNLPASDSLAFAEKDAERVYSTLISKEAGNFEFENVKKLIGPRATLENIRDALENWLPSQVQETDRAVVFFVGHGATDFLGRGYLIPYDIDPLNLEQTAYPMDRLGEVFSKEIKARWKILLADACHSGKITVSSTPTSINESLRGLPQGFLTLTSSRASEQSFEDRGLAGGNGVFSYFLTRGWAGEADVDPRDGVVTADELVSYVKHEVRAYARSRGVQQTPLEFGDFPDDLVLGFDPLRRQQIAASLPQLSNGSVVIEANLSDVEIAIDGQPYGTVGPSKILRVPGLASGLHKIRGVRMGYESVTVQVNVVPGATQTVSLRLLHQRTVKPAAKALVDRGEAFWEQSTTSISNLNKAADLFTRALREDSESSRAALDLCRVEQALGKTRDSLKSCTRAIEIDPDFAEARSMVGVLLMETGDYPEAVRQLQRVTTEDPDSSFAQSLLAEALYLADHPREAEEVASRAIALDESSGQAYLLRGEARRAQKKFDEAIEDYSRAIHVQEYVSGSLRIAAYWAVGTGMKKHRSGVQFLYKSQKASAEFGLCASEIGRENFQRAIRHCTDALYPSHKHRQRTARKWPRKSQLRAGLSPAVGQ